MTNRTDATKLIGNVDKLAAQFDELNKQLKETVTLVIKGQDAFNKQSRSQADVNTKTKQAKKALTDVEKIQKRYNKVTLETVRATEALREKRKALTDQVRKERGTFKKAGGLFRSMTKSILAAGAAMVSLRAAFMVVKNGMKTIVQFEKGMSEVRAITGATIKEFKALQENAILLGSTTSKTALQVAQLQKEYAKLGFTTSEILAATEATIDLSIAAGSDLADSAVVAASTIRGFGLSATETQRVVDVMAKSFTSSALDLEKFKTAMAIAGPVAKASGKSIEFTTARLGILADAGLDASTAGTSLRNMFLELNTKGLTWEQGLEKINNSTNKNVTALELFGKRGATAALILADNTMKAGELEESFNNAAGAAREMANIMEDNLAGDIEKAKSAWEGFILGLNDGTGALSKAGRAIVQFGTRAVSSLNILDLWLKREGKFTSKDFERLLAAMDIVETESGKTIADIISNFEELNKALTSEELLGKKEEFIKLFTKEGESVKAATGLWEAYRKGILEDVEIERQAVIDAEKAKIAAEEEAERVRRQLAIEREKERTEEVKKNIARLEKELAERLALEEQYKMESDAIADALVEEEIRLSDKELERFEKQLNDEWKLQQEAAQKEIAIIEERIAKEKQLEEDWQNAKIQIKDAALDAYGQILFENITAQQDEELARFQDEQSVKEDALKNQLDKGLINEREYEKKVKALRLKTRQEEAKAEKKKALFDIAINTAVGVAKAIPNLPLMATAAALGAIQAATVAARPVPKFEKGEVNIKGKRHSQGGISAEIEGGESVINRTGTANAPNILTAINNGLIKDVHLPNAGKMFSGADTKELAQQNTANIVGLEALINKQDKIISAINSKNNAPTWTRRGITEFDAKRKQRKTYIDKYFR